MSGEQELRHRRTTMTARERFVDTAEKLQAVGNVLFLTKKGLKLSRTTETELDKVARKLIENYAKEECRELADQIYTTLPRELRDMIYSYVWDSDTAEEAFHHVRPRLLNRAPWLSKCKRNPCKCFLIDEIPLWVQHQVVGLDMAREIATAYYRAMPPGRLGSYITEIEDFLMNDHFHLGLVPANHIRHLRITISPAQYKHLSIGAPDFVCLSEEGKRAVQKNLESLLELRHKSGSICTLILGDEIWGSYTDQVLEVLKPVYNALTQAGMRVPIYGHPNAAELPRLRVDFYYATALEDWYQFCRAAQFRQDPSEDEDLSQEWWKGKGGWQSLGGAPSTSGA